MRVLITGASGFLGSWLCRIISQSHEVGALVRENSSLFKISDLPDIAVFRKPSGLWSNVIEEWMPDVLILNDWWGVENKYRHDPKQFENVDRLLKVALSARNAGIKTIIGVGSQAELGSVNVDISESTPDNPTSAYGRAKVLSRIKLQDLLEGSDSRFVWMRIFSTYGPLDEGAWLIPNIVDALSADEGIEMTKGEQQWSYLHSYDLANAFSAVISNKKIDGIVNVGNPHTVSIRDVALKIAEILGKTELVHFGALDYRDDQVMKLKPLCEKLTNAGWFPKVAFEDGIKQTIEWLQRQEPSSIAIENGHVLDFKLPIRK